MVLALEDAGEDDAIGEGERVHEGEFEDVAAESVGARLEDSPEATVGVALAKGAEGFANGGGMMREVVDDGDAVDLCANLEAAFDGAEGTKGFFNGGGSDALPCSERGGGGGVECVVFASERQGEIGEGLAGTEEMPVAGAAFVGEITQLPIGARCESVTFYATKRIGNALGYIL